MKKLITMLAVAIAVMGAIATNAMAANISLAFGDSYYVGLIVDGIPSSEANEQGYVANLITRAPGSQNYDGFADDEIYNRVGSTIPVASLPAPQPASPHITSGLNNPIDVTGIAYILGKYGNDGSWVWYVGGLAAGTTVTLPQDYPGTGGGLSHITVFAPDGGLTVMLLGIGMGGLALLSRKFRS